MSLKLIIISFLFFLIFLKFNPFFGFCFDNNEIKSKKHIVKIIENQLPELLYESDDPYDLEDIIYKTTLKRTLNIPMNIRSFSGVWYVSVDVYIKENNIGSMFGYVSNCGKIIYYRDSI